MAVELEASEIATVAAKATTEATDRRSVGPSTHIPAPTARIGARKTDITFPATVTAVAAMMTGKEGEGMRGIWDGMPAGEHRFCVRVRRAVTALRMVPVEGT